MNQAARHHHTLIISQDATEIFFSVSSYTDAYLSYLFSPSPDSARVIPATLEAIPVLNVEEFGPFRINLEEDLRLVAQLVRALLLWQMEGFEASKLIASALGGLSDDEDDEDEDDGDDEDVGIRSDEEHVWS